MAAAEATQAIGGTAPEMTETVEQAEVAIDQAAAEEWLQTLAMVNSTRAHSEARLAVCDAEYMEELATETIGRQRRLIGWSAEKAAAAFSEAAATARQLVREDKQARLEDLVVRAEARATQTGLCSECIMHRMRLAPANVHPTLAVFYEQPLDRCVHGGSPQAGGAGVGADSGGWREGDYLGWRELQ